ncbi:8869_t:CDS:1, partial [Cetraspora pellucida]
CPMLVNKPRTTIQLPTSSICDFISGVFPTYASITDRFMFSISIDFCVFVATLIDV